MQMLSWMRLGYLRGSQVLTALDPELTHRMILQARHTEAVETNRQRDRREAYNEQPTNLLFSQGTDSYAKSDQAQRRKDGIIMALERDGRTLTLQVH